MAQNKSLFTCSCIPYACFMVITSRSDIFSIRTEHNVIHPTIMAQNKSFTCSCIPYACCVVLACCSYVFSIRLNTTSFTGPSWLRTKICLPVDAFHTHDVLSPLAVTMYFPSGLKATLFTQSSCSEQKFLYLLIHPINVMYYHNSP